MAKCNINLAVTFDSTADTPRIRALDIAEAVRVFLAATLDAANTRVEVHGAALSYVEAWEEERSKVDPLVEAANEALALDESNLWGNPAKDGLN